MTLYFWLWLLSTKNVCFSVSHNEPNVECYSKHRASSYLVNGDWVPSKPLNTYGNLKCPLELNGVTPTNEFVCLLDYQWEATTCKSKPFDALRFLSALKSKVILLSGDSVTKQTYIALICHLFEYAEPDLSYQNIPWARPVEVVNKDQVYSHQPHVTFLDDICFHFQYNVTICCCLAPDIYNKHADMVIWNAYGLHFHHTNHSNVTHLDQSMSADPLTHNQETYRSVLHGIAAYAKSHPSKLIVYRETSGQSFPGSLNGDFDNRDPSWIAYSTQRCKAQYEPINITAKGSETSTRSWSHLETWRQHMEKEIILHEHHMPYLNIYETQFSIPCEGGGHFVNECTHYHLPGVPDAWIIMLYNFVIHSPLVASWRETWTD